MGRLAAARCESQCRFYCPLQEVIVAEQLSAYHIDSVRDVTGGKMINSASSQPDASWLGCLKDARIVTLVHKK